MIERGLSDLRNRAATPTRMEETISRFAATSAATPRQHVGRWLWRVGAASAASIAVAIFALQPQTSLASSLTRIAKAAGDRPASIERVFRTVKGVKKAVYTIWLEGDKMATQSDNEYEGMNVRYDGKRFFIYGKLMGYAIISDRVTGRMGPEPFSAEKLSHDKNIKHWSVDHDIEWQGAIYDRYFIERQYDWQNIYVDPATSLPKGRESGMMRSGKKSTMDTESTIEYPADIPDSIFEPTELPGVHIYNETVIHNQILARAKAGMATTTVAGRKIVLRGLFRDLNGVIAAFVTGSEAQPEGKMPVMKVDGIQGTPMRWPIFNDTGHSLARSKSFFHVDGKPVFGYQLKSAKKIGLPSPMVLHIPIYTADKSRPVKDGTGRQVGYRTKLAGYATFKVAAKPTEVTLAMSASDVFNFMDTTPIQPGLKLKS